MYQTEQAKEALKAEGIVQKYQAKNGEVTAIDQVDFTVAEGEFVSLVGPSGCGKSTMLSIIAGIIQPTYGSIYIDGEQINGISPKIGYMLQKDNLLDWRSIYKNVILGLEIRKMLNPETKEYAVGLLKTYGLYEFRDKYPAQLSGGMRQRAALIRTLAVKPKILLLDEAFSALDYQTRLAVTDDVYRILKQENKTTIMVTHDISESVSLSDRVIVMSGRPAKVKNIHTIKFNLEHRTPLLCREQPEFRTYYNDIWRELDIHV